MKKHLLLILLFVTTVCNANHKIKLYLEKKDNTTINVYVDNDEFCPMSVKINFELINLKAREENNHIYIVDAHTKKQLITTLKVVKKEKPYKFSYTYWTNYGNYYNDKYDINYQYNLPYKSSKKFRVYQGYNGSFSHQNENALDFTMPVGTEIMAIREGIVIKVIDSNNINCERRECMKYNNSIIIYHSDGTFAEYAHIKQNGSKVKIGNKVAKGQLIGYSGNVGWSTGPHLHLVVFKQKLDKRETLKTKFKIGNGTKIEYLIEKKRYSRKY